MVEKNHILEEIRRTARENGGMPLGRERFRAATGIKETDWSGRYWARFGDAVREAGFQPNILRGRLPDDLLLKHLASLTRELGHFPVHAEMKLRAKSDAAFPSHNVFKRFGSKAGQAAAVAEWCAGRDGYQDVIEACSAVVPRTPEDSPPVRSADEADFGYVYLLKSGRYFKVGRSNAVGRRERELAIQLPEKASVVHTIKTDDPAGVELYWHRRFETRRKNGEWFELTAEDVSAFRRRRFM